jgi:hypothetical protein
MVAFEERQIMISLILAYTVLFGVVAVIYWIA